MIFALRICMCIVYCLKKVQILFFVFLLLGCEFLDYHPYDTQLGDDDLRELNHKSIEIIERKCADKDTVRFIMMGDSQGWYDETEDFVGYANENCHIDFVVHGGDITDFGMTEEFLWVHDDMKHLKVPYVALIGNHDILSSANHTYCTMYGAEDFAFTAGFLRFICLNTNALEYNDSKEIPNFSFMEAELKDSLNYTNSIVIMHAAPGTEQFNNNVKDVFHKTVCAYRGALFALNAHGHHTSINDLFGDDFMYYQCASMGKRSFLLFTVTPEGYTYEEILF